MSSTEVVKVADALPSREKVAAQLDRLEVSGDVSALDEIAKQARAFQEYEKQQNAAERANYFGSVKVMAEARIGSIDLSLHPTASRSVLDFGEGPINQSLRWRWRRLGFALQEGCLDKAVSRAAETHGAVTTGLVLKEFRGLDIGTYVFTAPLLERYQELYEQEGLTISEVVKRSGTAMARRVLSRPGTTAEVEKTASHIARRIAVVLGVDHRELQRVPRRRSGLKRAASMRPGRKLRGGRLDETYSLIRKALQELDRVTSGQSSDWGTAHAWDHLYEAEEIVGRALRYAPAE